LRKDVGDAVAHGAGADDGDVLGGFHKELLIHLSIDPLIHCSIEKESMVQKKLV
jgi:hypothetical protein